MWLLVGAHVSRTLDFPDDWLPTFSKFQSNDHGARVNIDIPQRVGAYPALRLDMNIEISSTTTPEISEP